MNELNLSDRWSKFDLVIITNIDRAKKDKVSALVKALKEEEVDTVFVSIDNNLQHVIKGAYVKDLDGIVFVNDDSSDLKKLFESTGIHTLSVATSLVDLLRLLKKLDLNDITEDALLKTGPIGPEIKITKIGPIGPKIKATKIGPIGPSSSIEPMESSELSLSDFLLECSARKYRSVTRAKPLTVERHIKCLQSLSLPVSYFSKEINSEKGRDLGLLLAFAQEIEFGLDELVGTIPPDDILGEIFSSFCIGK